jgi:hypothetical protein
MSHDVSVGGLLGTGPVLRKRRHVRKIQHAGKEARVRKTHMQEKKHVQGRHTCRKSNTCKTDVHAEEESMRGTHARIPSHDRVRVLVRNVMVGKPKTCISRYLGGLGRGSGGVVRNMVPFLVGWSLLLCRSKTE